MCANLKLVRIYKCRALCVNLDVPGCWRGGITDLADLADPADLADLAALILVLLVVPRF